MKMWGGAVYGKCSVILEKRQLWWCHWCEMNHSSTRSHLFTVILFMWRLMWLRIIGSLKVVNATSVTKCTIFGPSPPALCFLSGCCLHVDAFWFPSAAAYSVSVFLAFRQQPASVRQQRWNHCAQRHQAWKQVRDLTLNFCHFLLFLFLRSFHCLCVALFSYFPFGRFEL